MKISEITDFLEQAYDVLNGHFFQGELPRVIITVQSSPKAYGHYTKFDAWHEETKGYREINIGAETLDRNIENVCATLLHEMTHHYCDLHQICDVSRGGTYHNKRFKEQAELHGLIIDYNNRIGWSVTSPSPALVDFVEGQGWHGVNLARNGGQGASTGGTGGAGGSAGGAGRKPSSTRKYICPCCGCSVRATKTVNVGCLDCGVAMVVEEK